MSLKYVYAFIAWLYINTERYSKIFVGIIRAPMQELYRDGGETMWVLECGRLDIAGNGLNDGLYNENTWHFLQLEPRSIVALFDEVIDQKYRCLLSVINQGFNLIS